MRDEIDTHNQDYRLQVRLARLGKRGLSQANAEQIRAFADRCRMPLDMQAAMTAEQERKLWDDLIALFVQDPRVQTLWNEKLAEMKARLEAEPP
jgi:hypothetical protein